MLFYSKFAVKRNNIWILWDFLCKNTEYFYSVAKQGQYIWFNDFWLMHRYLR